MECTECTGEKNNLVRRVLSLLQEVEEGPWERSWLRVEGEKGLLHTSPFPTIHISHGQKAGYVVVSFDRVLFTVIRSCLWQVFNPRVCKARLLYFAKIYQTS